MDKVKTYLSRFRCELQKSAMAPQLQMLEDKTGAPFELVVAGALALLALLTVFGVGAGLICNVVGFVPPMYLSFKAIESEDKDDDTQWLIYWVVYATFSVLETFTDLLLYWIPFYYILKLLFLVWCMSPKYKGALFLYQHVLRDFLKKHEEEIDRNLDNVQNGLGKAAAEGISAAKDASNAAMKIAVEQGLDAQINAATGANEKKED